MIYIQGTTRDVASLVLQIVGEEVIGRAGSNTVSQRRRVLNHVVQLNTDKQIANNCCSEKSLAFN